MQAQIGHHLDRARVAALSGVIGEVTPVCPVLDALHRTLAKIYADKALDITVQCQTQAKFRGERQDFEEMAGNLLDNACKWAARTVTLTVVVDTDKSGTPRDILLCIEDDGPGLTDTQKHSVLQRGRRLDAQTPGTGLGLSIVADLAGLYDGSLELSDSDAHGLAVELRLPAA